jgi:hypothetical protein
MNNRMLFIVLLVQSVHRSIEITTAMILSSDILTMLFFKSELSSEMNFISKIQTRVFVKTKNNQ